MRPRAPAYTTRGIWENFDPILLVCHDGEGDWQFLPGSAVTTDELVVVHLGHITDREPRLTELADLPVGWAAEREAPDAPWERFKLPEADE